MDPSNNGTTSGNAPAPSSYAHVQQNRSKAAVHGVFWSAINALLPNVVTILVFAASSRFITPAQFGIVALAISIVLLLGALAPVGYGDAIIQRKDIEDRHLDSTFWFCVACSIGVYLINLAISWPLSVFYHQPELVSVLAVMGSKLIFDLIGTVPNALLARSMSFHLVARRTTIASLTSGATCMGLLFLGFGLWALVLSQLLTSIVQCVASVLSVKWRPNWKFDREALRELSRFGLYSSGNRFITFLMVDQLAIGALLGTVPLGIYSFARRIFYCINQLVTGGLGPVSGSLLASLQGEPQKRRDVFMIATFTSAVVSFPLFIGLAAVAADLIPTIFGAQWTDAVPATQGFCLIGLLSCIGVLQSSLINSQGRADWWMWYQVIQQTLTLIVIVVSYRYGVTILVLAMALKTWITWPVTLRLTVRILGVSVREYLVRFLPALLASLIMTAGVLAFRHYVPIGSPSLRLILEVLVGVIVYSASILLLAGSRLREIKTLLRQRRNKAATVPDAAALQS